MGTEDFEKAERADRATRVIRQIVETGREITTLERALDAVTAALHVELGRARGRQSDLITQLSDIKAERV